MCRLTVLQLLAWKLQGPPAADQPVEVQRLLQRLLQQLPAPAVPEQQPAGTQTQEQFAAVMGALGQLLLQPPQAGGANGGEASDQPVADEHDEGGAT
jgi:hypothetical protein